VQHTAAKKSGNVQRLNSSSRLDVHPAYLVLAAVMSSVCNDLGNQEYQCNSQATNQEYEDPT